MDENVCLLQEICRNCQMGGEAIRILMENVTDEAMRSELLFQRKNYQDVEREAEDLLNQAGQMARPISMMQEWGLKMGTCLNTLRDKSPQHAADLILQGSVMGLVDLIRSKRKYSSASQQAMELADRLLSFERDSFQRMEQFL